MKNWDIMRGKDCPRRQSLLPLGLGQEARQVNDGPVCQVYSRHEETHSGKCNVQIKSWHWDFIAQECVHRKTGTSAFPADRISSHGLITVVNSLHKAYTFHSIVE